MYKVLGIGEFEWRTGLKTSIGACDLSVCLAKVVQVKTIFEIHLLLQREGKRSLA